MLRRFRLRKHPRHGNWEVSPFFGNVWAGWRGCRGRARSARSRGRFLAARYSQVLTVSSLPFFLQGRRRRHEQQGKVLSPVTDRCMLHALHHSMAMAMLLPVRSASGAGHKDWRGHRSRGGRGPNHAFTEELQDATEASEQLLHSGLRVQVSTSTTMQCLGHVAAWGDLSGDCVQEQTFTRTAPEDEEGAPVINASRHRKVISFLARFQVPAAVEELSQGITSPHEA